jgi:hypothetical protein
MLPVNPKFTLIAILSTRLPCNTSPIPFWLNAREADMSQLVLRTLFVSGAIAGTLVNSTACSSGPGMVSKDDIAKQISSKMTDADGNKPDSVSCPDGLKAQVGAQLNCAMKVKGQDFNVNVTATSVNGSDVKFDMVETVDKTQVAQKISDQLTQQTGSKPDALTCPDNLKGEQGATLRCDLKDGNQTYGVTVTVTNVVAGDVNFDFKVDEHPK